MALDHTADNLIGFPVAYSPLIGREREVAQVHALLSRPDIALVTLSGPGGVGKTRLAIRAALEIAPRFADGAVYVSLAAISDPDLVVPTIASALGAWESVEHQREQVLAETLAGQQRLIVLDSFEQVVSAAPFLSGLLSNCPGVKVLVTSRVVLRITGEQEFPVPPLEVPSARQATSNLAALGATEAVSLFIQRARAVSPSFALNEANAGAIAELCRRLDGIPLAIELAAARVKVLSPQALLARLTSQLQVLTGGARDVPLRLQSMRDAIAWSYDLLDAEERALFRRLSIFVGGFSLDAAQAVSEANLTTSASPAIEDSVNVFDGIASLLDKSLVRQAEGPYGEPRFTMLETIREYGIEQLTLAAEENPVRDAQAAWFLDLAERTRPEMSGGARQSRSLDLLDLEHDNLRAALAWLDASRQTDRLVQLAGSLGWFWHLRGYVSEGRAWLERAIARAEANGSPIDYRTRALRSAGQLAWEQADYLQAVRYVEESRLLAVQSGDAPAVGHALVNLGVIAEKQGDDTTALDYYEQALTIFRGLSDVAGMAHSLINLGDASFRQGNLSESRVYTDEALQLSRRIGDPMFTALSLANDGQLLLLDGQIDPAARQFREALTLAAGAHNDWFIANALSGLAAIAAAKGDPVSGATWLGTARAICDALGTPSVPHHALFARSSATIQTALSEAVFTAAWLLGQTRSPEESATEAINWTPPLVPIEPATAAPVPAITGAAKYSLTGRELDVLRLVVDGKSSREIAEALYISPRTATTHVANILGKLGVNSRSAAVAVAFQNGIV